MEIIPPPLADFPANFHSKLSPRKVDYRVSIEKKSGVKTADIDLTTADIETDMSQKLIETSHGAIALDDNGGDGVPLLMLHANSCCKEEFVFQTRALGDKRRVIALDFPGHGASSDAIDARRTYNVSGYADAVLEVLGKLEVGRFAVLGHSLGARRA